MRHMRHGRVLGRFSAHRKALFRNLVSALLLTEEVIEDKTLVPNAPKVPGRNRNHDRKGEGNSPDGREVHHHRQEGSRSGSCCRTVQSACRTRYRCLESLAERGRMEEMGRGSRACRQCSTTNLPNDPRSKSSGHPLLCSCSSLHGSKRWLHPILRLAKPRLGDAGTRAILEFVGKNDRVSTKAAKPSFGDDSKPAE